MSTKGTLIPQFTVKETLLVPYLADHEPARAASPYVDYYRSDLSVSIGGFEFSVRLTHSVSEYLAIPTLSLLSREKMRRIMLQHIERKILKELDPL